MPCPEHTYQALILLHISYAETSRNRHAEIRSVPNSTSRARLGSNHLLFVGFSMEIQMQCRALSIHIRHQSCCISHVPKLRAIVMPKFGLYPILRHAQDWGQITYFSSDLRQRFATLCGVLSIHVRRQSYSASHALSFRANGMPKLGL